MPHLPSKLESLSPCHLLVCEDRDENLKLLKHLAKSFGCKLDVARNGQEAIDLSRDIQYDVILMDLEMPVKNGLEASKHIRTTRNSNQQTPIIAVTAEESEMVATASASFGIDEYLCKPIKPSLLHETIKKVRTKSDHFKAV